MIPEGVEVYCDPIDVQLLAKNDEMIVYPNFYIICVLQVVLKIHRIQIIL